MLQLSATVIYNPSAFLFPLFSCLRNLTVFCGAFALDQSHVAICLLLTNPIQEHIPAGALKPSGCVDGCHLLELICSPDSLVAFLEQVSVQLV